MLFTGVENLEHSPEADHEVGEEIDDGVVVSRRRILKLSALTAGTTLGSQLLGGPAHAAIADSTTGAASLLGGKIAFEKLVQELRPLSKQLIGQGNEVDEEAYLRGISALLSRVELMPECKPHGKHDFNMRRVAAYRPLVILTINMKPGARIRIHDHRDYNGVIFGLDGCCTIRNFEIEGREDIPRADEEFTIRETKWARITRGRVSTLSRRRDNIHDVVAGRDGAQLLDVFTYFSPKARSYGIVFDDKPVDADERLYRVNWKPRKKKKRASL
ncbi:MAG: hypothetical protein AAF581_15205 [Planctomycetota bacterium]